MKKFSFRLQKVLDVREIEEKEKMKKVAEAIQKHKQEHEVFSKLQQQERLAIQSLTHIREKHANAGLLRILQQSLQGHHRRVDGQKQIVVDAFNRINDCKKELLEKTKEKKILKKLKEIEHQKHKEKSKKIEQKFTDETANIKAFKSRTESKL